MTVAVMIVSVDAEQRVAVAETGSRAVEFRGARFRY